MPHDHGEHSHDHEDHEAKITIEEHAHDHHSHDHDHFAHDATRSNHNEVEYRANRNKLIIMMVMIVVVFFAELLVGFIGNSLALLSDAFHMLSDAISLIVGAVALKLAQRPRDSRQTYGWGRAEIIGGLVNGVFLISVVFFIYMEAIQRFVEPMTIGQPVMVLVVGTIGLLVNLIGLIMFRGHAHGHSHNDKESEGKHSHNHNMFGVFLHILGDFLGSIGVIISSVLLLIFDVEQHKWAKYVDPLVSVILATIILASTVPLVLNTIKILLQRVPDNIDLDQVCSQIEHLEGVLSVHELHIWHHSSNRVIGTLHVKLDTKHDFMTLAPRIQKILHSHGVHSTTIQPEYMNEDKEVKQCDLQCDVDGVYDAQDWQDTAVTVSTVPLLALEVND